MFLDEETTEEVASDVTPADAEGTEETPATEEAPTEEAAM